MSEILSWIDEYEYSFSLLVSKFIFEIQSKLWDTLEKESFTIDEIFNEIRRHREGVGYESIKTFLNVLDYDKIKKQQNLTRITTNPFIESLRKYSYDLFKSHNRMWNRIWVFLQKHSSWTWTKEDTIMLNKNYWKYKWSTDSMFKVLISGIDGLSVFYSSHRWELSNIDDFSINLDDNNILKDYPHFSEMFKAVRNRDNI